MFTLDWTVLGITELILAILVASGVSAFLAWRLPMTPLAPAIIAGGTAAGLVLLFGRAYPAIVVVLGGGAAAFAGLLYDRAVIGQWRLALAEAVVAGVTAGLSLPLARLGASLGLGLPAPALIGAIAVLVALFSMGLRRADRLPGMPAAIAACVAALGTLFAVWRGVVETQSIWWLGTLAVLFIGATVISRSRATPFGAAGTSYVALTVAILLLAILAFARLVG